MDILDDMGVSKLSAKALYSLVALYFTVLLHMNILCMHLIIIIIAKMGNN